MIIDKKFTYIIQNESTYFTFYLHNDLYYVNQLLQQLDCNILYDKENNIIKETYLGKKDYTYSFLSNILCDFKTLKEKYNIAKRTYGLASDAEKIVGAAARKAAKGTKWGLKNY